MNSFKKVTAAAVAGALMFGTELTTKQPLMTSNTEITAAASEPIKSETLLITKYDTYAAVSGCNTAATEVVIPAEFDGLPVKVIDEWAFWNCTELTGVTIPDSVVSIGYSAFSYCTSLTGVAIPSSVIDIGEFVFSGCNSLTEITVDPDNAVYCGIDGVLYSKNVIDLISVPAGKEGTVVIPDTVTGICSDAFSGCIGLTDITIPDNVTSIGYSAFFGCTGLNVIKIPKKITRIGDYAFSGCTDLTDIIVDSENPDYCGVDGILYSKDMTELIKVPAGKKGAVVIPDGVTNIHNDTFSDCNELTGVTIPSSIQNIGNSVFSSCTGLCDIFVDPNNTVYCGTDGILYSKDMKKLISVPAGKQGLVVIPDGVTTICSSAFSSCIGLTGIKIPSSLTIIDNVAFLGCDALDHVYYKGTRTQWNEIQIGCDNENLTSATIYYYEANAVDPNPDMDGDNIITASDSQIVLLAYLDIFMGNTPELTAQQLIEADVNKDGEITANDAQYILLYYLYNTIMREPTTWNEILNS